MKTAHTVMTAGLLKPESASAGVNKPDTARMTNTINAIKSMRKRSLMSKRSVATTIPSTSTISVVKGFTFSLIGLEIRIVQPGLDSKLVTL